MTREEAIDEAVRRFPYMLWIMNGTWSPFYDGNLSDAQLNWLEVYCYPEMIRQEFNRILNEPKGVAHVSR